MPPDILFIHIFPSLILRLLCTTTTTTYIFPSCDYLYPCIPSIRPIHFTSKISRLSFSFNIHHRRSTINSILLGSFFIIIFLFEPTHFISLPFIINRYLPTLHSPHIRSNQNIYNSSLVVFRIPYPLPPRSFKILNPLLHPPLAPFGCMHSSPIPFSMPHVITIVPEKSRYRNLISRIHFLFLART